MAEISNAIIPYNVFFSRIGPTKRRWQQRIAKRFGAFLDPTTVIVDDDDHDHSNEAPNSSFLSQTPERGDVALLRQGEVCIDRYIATGSFSDVFQVSGFYLLGTTSDNDNENGNDDSRQQQQQQRRRQQLHETARDKVTGESRFVIKNVRRSLSSNPEQLAEAATSLELEAKFLARFDHENIIKLRGCCYNKNNSDSPLDGFFIILDRVHATLSDRINDWKAEPQQQQHTSSSSMDIHFFEEKLRYGLEMANALDYLHQRRIIYRDLKPPNVGITRDNHIRIFDFGLCRELPPSRRRRRRAVSSDNDDDDEHDYYYYNENDDEEERFHMTCAGTRRYMAPEVLLKARNGGYNLKADVYSWAMVFYEMISLRQPYESYNRDLHYMLACEEGRRPKLLDEWPTEIVQLLRSAWSHSLAARSTIQDICHYITDIFAENNHNNNNNNSNDGGVEKTTTRSTMTHGPPRAMNHIYNNSIGIGIGNNNKNTITMKNLHSKVIENRHHEDHLIMTDCSSFSQSSHSSSSSSSREEGRDALYCHGFETVQL